MKQSAIRRANNRCAMWNSTGDIGSGATHRLIFSRDCILFFAIISSKRKASEWLAWQEPFRGFHYKPIYRLVLMCLPARPHTIIMDTLSPVDN
jgi:hypothetical protein